MVTKKAINTVDSGEKRYMAVSDVNFTGKRWGQQYNRMQLIWLFLTIKTNVAEI